MGLEIDPSSARDLLNRCTIEPMRRPGTLNLLELQNLFEGAKEMALLPNSNRVG